MPDIEFAYPSIEKHASPPGNIKKNKKRAAQRKAAKTKKDDAKLRKKQKLNEEMKFLEEYAVTKPELA